MKKRTCQDPVGVRWVEDCFSVFGPLLAAANGAWFSGPLRYGLFVVAQLVQHRCVFDKNRFEGRRVARDLVGQDLKMQFSKELFQGALKIWT